MTKISYALSQWVTRAIGIAALLLLLGLASATLHAEVRLPNGEYTETNEDLKVKVLGGYVTIARSWTNGRWYINPAWADLLITFDSLDGSVKALDRAGSIYERSGNGIFIFDKRFFIQQTANAFRWYDQRGNWITYDATGHMTAYGDRNNVKVSFQLDASGRRTQVLDNIGNPVLSFQYNGTQLAGVTDRAGRQVQYSYTGGQLTQVIDVLGNSWTYTYDGNGQITSRTDPEGHKTTIAYAQSTPAGVSVGMRGYLATNLSLSYGINAKASAAVSAVASTGSTPRDYKIARVGSVTDAEGNVTTYSYAYDRQSLRHTVTQKFPGGRQVISVYDRDGWLLTQTVGNRVVRTLVRDGERTEIVANERGLVTRTVYDESRNPLNITYPDGTSVSATYDSVYGNPLVQIDELGTVTTSIYDAKGNLLSVTEAAGTIDQRSTNYTYDQYGRVLTMTRKASVPSEDATTTYSYDGLGNRISVTDPMGGKADFTHDVMGNVLTARDPRNNIWPRSYNARGWLLSRSDPLGNATTATYDRVGNRTRIVDPAGNATTFAYNRNDWLVSVTNALGGTTRIQYDQDGNRIKETDAATVAVTYSYDSDGRHTRTVDGNGNATEVVYGDNSNALNGLIVATLYPTFAQTYKYDARDRVVATVQQWDSGGVRTTLVGRDAKGNVVSRTEPGGKTTLYAYDSLNRITSAIDALGNVTKYAYDTRDNIRAVIDANGNLTAYDYDLANRVVRETRPLGNVRSSQYDAAGVVVVQTNARGEQRRFTYDAAGRRIGEAHYATSQSLAPSKAIQFSYDAKGVLTGYSDGTSSATYGHDALGRKISETLNFGSFSKSIAYSFYANGVKQSFTYPDGFQVDYTYDAGDRLIGIATPHGTIAYASYMWNVPTQIVVPGAVNNLSFDGLMRPVTVKVQALGSGTPAAPLGPARLDFRYSYDEIGNVVKRSTPDGDFGYEYDSLNRLTAAVPPASLQATPAKPDGLPVEAYGYDPLHNRVASQHQPGPWVYDRNNALTQMGQGSNQANFGYDENGNLSVRAGNGQTRSFAYDIAERVTEVSDQGIAFATYTYDPFGRRLSKRVGASTTYFQYADEGLVAEFDANGALTKSYGWRPGGTWGTNPQFMRVGGTLYYYHNDHLGTPQLITDGAGAQVWSATYEGFGRVSGTPGATIENNLRLPGQYYDLETDSHYNLFRDYSPSLGRYVQADPLGLRGGFNVFLYAGANPVSNMDPLGLICHWHPEFMKKWEPAGDSLEVLAEFEYELPRYGWEPQTRPNLFGIGKPEPPARPFVCSSVLGYDRWHVKIWRSVHFEQLNLYMRQCKECGSCGGISIICTPWEKLGPIDAREKRDFPWYTWTYEGFFPSEGNMPCVEIPVIPPLI